MGHSTSALRKFSADRNVNKLSKDDMVIVMLSKYREEPTTCKQTRLLPTSKASTTAASNGEIFRSDEYQDLSTLGKKLNVPKASIFSGKRLLSSGENSPRSSGYQGSNKGSDPTFKSADLGALTKEEYKWLRLTCDLIKQNAEVVALKGMKKIFEEVPESSITFKKSPTRPIKFDESWELMGQGIMILYELDRCVERVKSLRNFRKHVDTIVKSHLKYGVPVRDLHKALFIFHELVEDIIVANQTRMYFHLEDTNLAWSKFFILLHEAVDASAAKA